MGITPQSLEEPALVLGWLCRAPVLCPTPVTLLTGAWPLCHCLGAVSPPLSVQVWLGFSAGGFSVLAGGWVGSLWGLQCPAGAGISPGFTLHCSPAPSQLGNGDGMEKSPSPSRAGEFQRLPTWGWMDGEDSACPRRSTSFLQEFPPVSAWIALHPLVQQARTPKCGHSHTKMVQNPPKAALGCEAQIQHLSCSSHLCNAHFWVLWSHPRISSCLQLP